MTRVSVDQLPLHEHPEVSRAEATEAAAAAAHRASLARFAPVLAAAAELQSHRSQLVGGQHGESWTVGLVLQVNLFNGLQDLAQRRATEADLDAVRVSTRNAESAVRLRIRQAQLALEASEARLAVAARSVALAQGAATLERQRMDNGRSDAAALVRSQAALLDTELRLLAARHARELARVDLLVALGGINVNPDEVSP
jgi:outer membrane protein TolC